MDFEVWAETDVGLKRKANEDSILVDERLGLFVVADGMGGHKGGDVASNIAVRTAQEILHKRAEFGRISPESLIRKIYKEASARIYKKGHVDSPELKDMGTTMVLGILVRDQLYIGNVGDSRCYLYRNGNLWQLTVDHSFVHEQVRAGMITEEEAETVAGKNVITKSVGYEESVEPDIIVRTVRPNEQYLFCSDGLSGLVSGPDITKLFQADKPSKFVAKSISLAKKGGGDDNISSVLLRILP